MLDFLEDLHYVSLTNDEKVEMDIADGQKAGVTGTPTLFVNGRKVKKRDIESLSKLIDEELAATEQ